MGKISEKLSLNRDILKQCREQLDLSIETVESKVSSIAKIENGSHLPTYKQLDTLADFYEVPHWVFISDTLPEEYRYDLKPAFRAFRNVEIFTDSKIRKLITKVETYRDLLLELSEDLDEPVPQFQPPDINQLSIDQTAASARKWLSLGPPLDFNSLKIKVEQKNIFVFLTSKYKGWSHIDRAFRGLCVLHKQMPIIIINDSDSKKAQSFTLIHELGHLLMNEMKLDGEDDDRSSKEEKWCDQFAGKVLMPANSSIWNQHSYSDLSGIKEIAKKFEVSPASCLVRLRQLEKIGQADYNKHEKDLKQEYDNYQKKLKESSGGSSRNISKEIYYQFGDRFVRTVLTSWENKEISLHKVVKLFECKRPRQIMDLREML